MTDRIDELKFRIKDYPISDIIGKYISLQKKGSNHKGYCPFHNDTNPSLTINDSKGMFMCFVDGIGGDAISFVQKYKKIGYLDSLKDICHVLGIPWNEYYKDKNESPKIQTARKILSKATLIYQKIALDQNPIEFSNFTQSRNLNEETIKEFSIGYAPKNNVISNYLQSIPNLKEREMTLNIALEIGIIRRDRKKPTNFFDTFRERIIFPIINHFGQPAGFSARATKDYQKKAKYINSEQSFIFNKKTIFYGFHTAKSYIRNSNSAIIVEGQMDVIGLYKHGIKNVIAAMGLGVSKNTLQTLKATSKNIYLALDSDTAGYKAMERINEICLKENIIPLFLDFSPHKDPDEYLKHNSIDSLKKMISNATPFLDHLLNLSMPVQTPEITDKKLSSLEKIFPILAPLGESLAATERLIDAASKLGLKSDPVPTYKNYLNNIQKTKNNDNKQITKPTQPIENTSTHSEVPVKIHTPPVSNTTQISATEKHLLQELIKHPECLSNSKLSTLLEYINNQELKKFISKLQNFIYEIDEKEYIAVVESFMGPDDYSINLKEIVGAALFNYEKMELSDRIVNHLLSDYKRKLMEECLKEKRNILLHQQTLCNTREKVNKLMHEINHVDKELMELKSQKKS